MADAAAAGPLPPGRGRRTGRGAGRGLTENGRYRFFDWGDASVTHPFPSLLVPLRVAADVLGVTNGDPVLRRLRDACLEPWGAYGSPAELRKQVALALRIGRCHGR